MEKSVYDVRRRLWVSGGSPPRRSPNYPKCPKCGGESYLIYPDHYDSYGMLHKAAYDCPNCDNCWGGESDW